MRALKGCLILLTALGLAACEKKIEDKAEEEARGPSWLDHAKISVTGSKPAFENNTEVMIKVLNTGDEPIVIRGLEQSQAAVLLHAGGKTAAPHRVSVGVAKPIVVAPRGSKATSLLFQASEGRPEALKLYGKTYSFPAPP
jgi:hypothetical protein